MAIGYGSTILMNDKQFAALSQFVESSSDSVQLMNTGVKIERCNLIPDSVNDDYWVPDTWGPFAMLEASDESWARPLGLGRIVSRQKAIAGMEVKFNDAIFRGLMMEPQFQSESEFRFRGLLDYVPVRPPVWSLMATA